jgi:histidinol-phosphate aminotransferase
MALTPRPGIMTIAPYVGGESNLPGQDRIIKLSSNESPFGASPRAIEAYKALAGDLHRYPDGHAVELREAIARHHGLDPARVVCGAGSDEVIALLVRAYAGPGDEVLYSRHGFLMYAIAAQSAGATPVTAPERNLTADVDALLARVTPRTRMLFLANPNNPTGSYLPAAEVKRLRDRLAPEVLLVLDAAYAEYVTRPDYEAGAVLVEAYDNVVMTRTFSKIYGLAALRLGWAYCPPEIADVLNRVRGPFNTGAAAQAAAVAALEDRAHTEKVRLHNERWLPWFSEQVQALGLIAHPSLCNFLLVQFPEATGGAQKALAFLNRRGVIPRQMAGYGLPDCLRFTIGTAEEMELTVAALRDFIATGEAR